MPKKICIKNLSSFFNKHYIYLPPIGQGTKRKTYPIDMQLLIQTPMQP